MEVSWNIDPEGVARAHVHPSQIAVLGHPSLPVGRTDQRLFKGDAFSVFQPQQHGNNPLIQVSQVINLPQISQISQILAAHRHAIAQISYGLLRLKSLINRRIQSVKSKIIVAIAALICLICCARLCRLARPRICGRYKTFESCQNAWHYNHFFVPLQA